MARVLIVQGSGQSRADMAATLRAEGYEIIEADTVEDGGELIRSAAPHAVLLDPRLPNRSGYELYAQLRKDEDTRAIPVLFLPTDGGGRAGRESVAVGGLDVVTRIGVALRTRTVNEDLREAGFPAGEAFTDALTGLANRRAMERLAKLETARARLSGDPLAAIAIDLDGFARVNEAWGYAVGDHALQAFAGLLHNSVRGGDRIGRWHGASFLALLPGTGLDAAWHVAERARRRIEVLGAAFAGLDGPEPTERDQHPAGKHLTHRHPAYGRREEREAAAEQAAADESDLLPEEELDADPEEQDELAAEAAAGGGQAGETGTDATWALSASLGVAERGAEDEWEDLLNRSEAALRRAKRTGRNRTAVA